MALINDLSIHQSLGRRGSQQDRYVACSVRDGLLLGVFDGHGPQGAQIAERAALAAPKLVADALYAHCDPGAALRAAIQSLIALCCDGGADVLDPDADRGTGGSTATLAYVVDDHVTVAVLGDSPALVATAAGVQVAPEHCVEDDEEALRRLADLPPEAREGLVVADGYLHRHWASLALTRALGDPEFADVLYLEPAVRDYRLAAGEALVLASDAIRVSKNPKQRLEVYRELAQGARTRTAHALASEFIATYNPSDNLTLLVCQLHEAVVPARAAEPLW